MFLIAVRLVDLRGHGLSDCPPDGYDTATMVDDVLALLGSSIRERDLLVLFQRGDPGGVADQHDVVDVGFDDRGRNRPRGVGRAGRRHGGGRYRRGCHRRARDASRWTGRARTLAR